MFIDEQYGISVYSGATNITEELISYEWNKEVCTGIGLLTITALKSVLDHITIGGVVTLYENSALKMTTRVVKITEDDRGVSTIECQDKSKNLIDYFITESYTIEGLEYTRPWIEQFLTEAQVGYSFTTSSQGPALSNNTTMGMMAAYEQIMNLLQQSGWYIEFSPSGTAIIGKLTSDITSSVSIDKERIIEISVEKNDGMLRNRGVIWGNSGVYADIYRPTPWDRDSGDKRAFVIANGNIPNNVEATNLAKQGLDEFARITLEKTIQVEGLLTVNFATNVSVNSDIFTGSGRVTTYGTSMSANGLITNIVLDQRCPRLFGFYWPMDNYGDGFVYVGTDGGGVRRKGLGSSTWSNFSNGLSDLHISDLSKSKDILACVTVSGEGYMAYGGGSSWTPLTFSPLNLHEGDVVASGILESLAVTNGIMARACTIDKTSNNIRLLVDTIDGANRPGPNGLNKESIGVATSGAGARTWVLDYYSNGFLNEYYPVYTIEEDEGTIYTYAAGDIDNDGANDYITVVTSGLYTYDWLINEEFGLDTGGKYPDNITSKTHFSNEHDYGDPVSVSTHYPDLTYDANHPERTLSTMDNSSDFIGANWAIQNKIYTARIVNGYRTRKDYVCETAEDFISSTFLSETISRFLWIKDPYGTPIIAAVDYDWDTDTIEETEIGGLYSDITWDYDWYTSAEYYNFIKFDGGLYFCVTFIHEDYLGFDIRTYKIDISTGVRTEVDYFTTGPSTPSGEGGLRYFALRLGYNSDPVAFPMIYNGTVKACLPYIRAEWNSPGTWVPPWAWWQEDGWYIDPKADWYLCDAGSDVELWLRDDGFWDQFDNSPPNMTVHWPGEFTWKVQFNRSNFVVLGEVSVAYYLSDAFSLTEDDLTVDAGWSGIYGTDLIFDDSTTKILYDVDVGEGEYGTYYWVTKWGEKIKPVTVEGYELRSIFGTVDSITGQLYGVALSEELGMGIVRFDQDGVSDLFININMGHSPDISSYPIAILHGSWFCFIEELNYTAIRYIARSGTIEYPNTTTKILRRTGTEFEVLKEGLGITPMALEISQSSLVLAHSRRNLYSLKMFVPGADEWLSLSTTPGNDCFDVRYTFRQDNLYSDSDLTIFYTTSGILMKVNIDSVFQDTEYDSGIMDTGVEYLTLSGVRWVETTNYKYPYQYVFAATSGIPAVFMEQNYEGTEFYNYSTGLPDSAITIIRIDDEI